MKITTNISSLLQYKYSSNAQIILLLFFLNVVVVAAVAAAVLSSALPSTDK